MIRDEMAEANHAPQSCWRSALCVIKKLYIENRPMRAPYIDAACTSRLSSYFVLDGV
jgi:hypothetical protein